MILSLALGLLTGLILSLTGAGGGILAVPLLVFGAQQSVATAGPVGLAAVALAAGFGAIMGLRKQVVRYKAALLIAATGMVLSPAGLWLAHRVDNRLLTAVFALVLLYVAFNTYRKATRGAASQVNADRPVPCIRDGATGRFIWTSRCAMTLGVSGAVAGFLSGLLGVGGGFVVVPVLNRYTDLEMQSAVSTSLAVIALISVTGVLASVAAGSLSYAMAAPFSAGALAGMVGGRRVSERLAGRHLQIGFAVVSGLVALGMLVKALH